MTVGALFGHVCMLVNKGPLIFHVATGAKSFGGNAFEIASVGRKVRVMAVCTGHLVLGNRMVRELGKLHLDLHMAASTELFLFMAADFLL